MLDGKPYEYVRCAKKSEDIKKSVVWRREWMKWKNIYKYIMIVQSCRKSGGKSVD